MQVWRALMGLTSGIARTVVQWRGWIRSCGASYTYRLSRNSLDFAAMGTRTAKAVSEAREIIVGVDRKLKAIRDLTEESVSDIHANSVLIGL